MLGLLITIPTFALAEDTGTPPATEPTATTTSAPITSEENDTPSKGKFFTPVGRGFRDSLYSPTDVDFFRLYLKSNGNLTFSIEQKQPGTSPNGGWQVDVYPENDLAKSIHSVTLPETRLSASFQEGLPGSAEKLGTLYYIRVSSLNPASTPLGEYSISGNFTESENFEKFPNESPAVANSVALNTQYSGNLSSATDMDYFRFSVATDDQATIKFSQAVPGVDGNIGWTVGLFGENDLTNPIQSAGLAATMTSIQLDTPLKAGTYYLVVTSKNTAAAPTENYQFLVQTASGGGTIACAQVITYGQHPITGRWVTFPTPCEIPLGWNVSATAPDGVQDMCADKSSHASFTPELGADGNLAGGLVNIPALDVPNASGGMDVFNVQIKATTLPTDPVTFGLDLVGITPVQN
jgi:hypothetical protein